ncbi:hypothetical protein BH20CHL6_BH20CHL6_13580 [soil metagenome]
MRDASLRDPAAPRPRRRWLRLAAILFVLYGLSGYALLGFSGASIAQPLDGIGELSVSIEDQRAALLRSLEETGETIGGAAQGIRNVDASLDQAQQSSQRAAGLARDVSFTMNEIATAMNVEILGVQPFVQVVPAFQRAGQQLNDLGTDLDAIATAVGQNSADAQGTADNLVQLRATIGELAETVDEGPSIELSSDALRAIRLALFGLIAWMLVFATGSILLGVALWRWAGARG